MAMTYSCPLCSTKLSGQALLFHFLHHHPGHNPKQYRSSFDQQRKDYKDAQKQARLQTAQKKRAQAQAQASAPEANGHVNGSSSFVTPGRALEEAAIIAITPRRFEVNSSLVWQAKLVSERELGFRPTENIGDWLDTYIFWSMKQFGITLGGYVVERPKPARVRPIENDEPVESKV